MSIATWNGNGVPFLLSMWVARLSGINSIIHVGTYFPFANVQRIENPVWKTKVERWKGCTDTVLEIELSCSQREPSRGLSFSLSGCGQGVKDFLFFCQYGPNVFPFKLPEYSPSSQCVPLDSQ
jgi:hypothetical protein